MSSRPRVLPGVNFAPNEKMFMADVRKYAKDRDWLEYHTHTSYRSPAGFLDLCMVRPPRLVFAELKGPDGVLSPRQIVWRDRLMAVPGIEVYVWWPKDWDEVIRILW
jgi:hypothetical protein